jgi:hypothetical protein
MVKLNPRHQYAVFDTSIQGIPCTIAVTSYCAGSPARRDGMLAGPEEDAEIEFEVYDRKGYTANWLYNKMTFEDADKIKDEALEVIRGY